MTSAKQWTRDRERNVKKMLNKWYQNKYHFTNLAADIEESFSNLPQLQNPSELDWGNWDITQEYKAVQPHANQPENLEKKKAV